jgi:hypothetical protein
LQTFKLRFGIMKKGFTPNSPEGNLMTSDTKKQSQALHRVIDPSDPLHDSIEAQVAGMSGAQAVRKLMEMFPPKTPPPNQAQPKESDQA